MVFMLFLDEDLKKSNSSQINSEQTFEKSDLTKKILKKCKRNNSKIKRPGEKLKKRMLFLKKVNKENKARIN